MIKQLVPWLACASSLSKLAAICGNVWRYLMRVRLSVRLAFRLSAVSLLLTVSSGMLAAELNTRNSGAVPTEPMDPYGWAKAGNVPDYFGPVLDGQSLWRVARRLNTALDVSVEQMMWALYRENPEAFVGVSVDGLMAGSVLRIPDRDRAARYSTEQVKAWLADSVMGDNTDDEQDSITPAIEIDDVSADDDFIESDLAGTRLIVNAEAAILPFDGLQDPADSIDGGVVLTPAQLTAQLRDKVDRLLTELADKQLTIDSLEQRLSVLESKFQSAAASLALANNVTDGTRPQIRRSNSPAVGSAWRLPIEYWLLGIAGLVGFAVLLRGRRSLLGLSDGQRATDFLEDDSIDVDSLTLTVTDEQYEMFEAGEKGRDFSGLVSRRQRRASQSVSDQGFDKTDPELDLSEMRKQSKQLSIAPIHENLGVENSDVGEQTLTLEVAAPTPQACASLQSRQGKSVLEQHIDKMVADGKPGLALSVLDLARQKDLDQPSYDYQRLRLLLAAGDEDGFYRYYERIEEDLEKFDTAIQLDVARLVNRLGLQH